MNLTPASIRNRLSTRAVGKKIQCLGTIDSTNDAAWEAAVGGAEHGLAIFAEEQKKGRGRHGRVWHAPKGSSVICSVVLRTQLPADRVPLVTAIAALAVSDAVQEVVGLDSLIQFPNDVYVNGRKIAGVLVESRFISGWPDLFVVGMGLNVNLETSDFPKDLRETATSMSIEKGGAVSRLHAARALLEALDRWVPELEGTLKPIRKAWRERSAVLGNKVRILEKGRAFTGVVENIDPIDGVELRLDAGSMRLFRGEHIEHLALTDLHAQH